MGPSLSCPLWVRGPEDDGEVGEVPLHIIKMDTGEQCIKAGISGIFQRATCEAVGDVVVKEGIPICFSRDMPFWRAKSLSGRGRGVCHELIPLIESSIEGAVGRVITQAIFFGDAVVSLWLC